MAVTEPGFLVRNLVPTSTEVDSGSAATMGTALSGQIEYAAGVGCATVTEATPARDLSLRVRLQCTPLRDAGYAASQTSAQQAFRSPRWSQRDESPEPRTLTSARSPDLNTPSESIGQNESKVKHKRVQTETTDP